jgi:Mrp family chromosome partitioning ATPase
LAVDVTGVRASDLQDFENKVKAAEGRLQLVGQQMDNMRQLEQCRINEFSVSVPASMETTELKSNRRKMFVLTLFAFSAILCAPVLAVEWLLQRESPVARFASRWGLPVIAERLLSNYSPTSRKPSDWRVDDAIRMTTLRIQQSLGQSGGVVLVSGLGNTPTPVSLMSAIAECLAQREERVLLVDAIDPSTGSSSLSAPAASAPGPALPRLLPREKQPLHNGKNTQLQKVFGLSEYLSRECEGVTDLIQPTACPGVDLISSGANRFPNEAMASSCITELFEHCRSTYTMILVAGPPVADRADFQMLAARADAILLAADRASISDPINRAVVQDLIELRAPVIGIVA